MKLTEFQTHKCSGFITVPFSLVWSKDNFLAFVTDKGVNVIELKFSGLRKEGNIDVKQWFIKPRQNVPSYNCKINVAKLAETLRPDELFKFILDRTLSPRMSLNGVSANVLSTSWSPYNPKISQTSLLMILTDQGSLDLYSHGESDWVLIGSISEHWYGLCVKKWNNQELSDHSPSGLVSELKRRAYKVKMTSFTWGKCHNDEWLSLFTSNLSGEIMLWKLKILESKVEITNLLIIMSDLDSINCLHCLSLSNDSFMLLASCINGKIQCYSIENNSLKAKLMVWSDMDHLPLNMNGPVGTILPEGILYVVPKLNHIMFFWLDTDAHLVNFATHSMEDINISGIAWLKDKEFLVSTRNGSIYVIQVDISSFSLEVSVKQEEPLLKNNTSFSYHGIVPSHNRCIFAVANSMCSPHDPSVLKEPTTISLFSVQDDIELDSVLLSTSSSVFENMDILELIRLDCVGKGMSLIKNDSLELYSTMDIGGLKKNYWLKKCSMSNSDQSKFELTKQQELLCDDLKKAIISNHLFTRVNSFIGKSTVSDEDKSLLSLAKIWLIQYTRTGSIKAYIKKSEILINAMNSLGLQEKEICPLCDSECNPITSDLWMVCSQGHKVKRCPRTLVPIISPPYYTCMYCAETYSFGTDECPTCIICDAPLRFNKFQMRRKEDYY